MNTMLDLVGSYIIGGFLLLAIIGLIFYFSTQSQVSKLSEISQATITETGKVIEYDFNKLGYRVESGNKVVALGNNAITFRADLDNNGVADTIYYSVITNNGSKLLRRTVSNNSVRSWDLPVRDASIVALDSLNATTNVISAVKGVVLTLQLETVAADSEAAGSYWKRKFFPRNL